MNGDIISIWIRSVGLCLSRQYLDQIDSFIRRIYRFGYENKIFLYV